MSNPLPTAEVPTGAVINRVAVKPPPFWKQNPVLWFAQLESQFVLAGVTADDTKYSYVVAALDEDMATEVQDILASPPSTDRYPAIKNALIARLSQSETKRLEKLLRTEELGDRTPSQLLRRLRTLANNAVNEDILRNIWLSRLPPDAQKILTVCAGDLDALAQTADRIAEMYPSTCVTTVCPQPQADNSLAALQAQIAELTAEVTALRTHCESNRRKSRRYRSPGKRSRSPSSARICWYHRRFGSEARKCSPPCEKENSTGSQ